MTTKETSKDSLKRKRHAERRRVRRRQEFLTKVGPTLVPENFSPKEATDFLFGSLAQAKRVARRAERRQTVASAEGCSLPGPIQYSENLPSAPRPARVLSRLNRSSIFPPLAADEIAIEALKINEILAALQSKHQNAPAHQLLDAFATASGLSWDLCAEILLSRKLIAGPIDAHDLVVTQSARQFRTGYNEGRRRYATLITAGEIPQRQGDWAYFEDCEFEALLPGIIVPTKLKREHYLTNLISAPDGLSVDVYTAPELRGLFRHPFFEDFNPLFFGKGPSERNFLADFLI
jgi:hypothetical protein